MASEARALLDEQVEALNELRDAAQLAYTETAALPALIRTCNVDADSLASYLGRLVIDRRERLDQCLSRAQILGETARRLWFPRL